VDIYDPTDVMWGISMRGNPQRDVFIDSNLKEVGA